jgi:hypothetical protein
MRYGYTTSLQNQRGPVWNGATIDPHHPKIQDTDRPSAGKIMASVFWDSEGVIYVNFLPPHATVNAQYYSNLLLNDVHIAVHKKRRRKLSTGTILLRENARPHTANLTTLASLGGKP